MSIGKTNVFRETKIYVAFSSSGLSSSSQTYPLHHPEEKVLSNQEILTELKGLCEGVEFVGQTDVEDAADTVAKVRRDRANLDGVLYFGALPDGLADIGLPVIAVYPL